METGMGVNMSMSMDAGGGGGGGSGSGGGRAGPRRRCLGRCALIVCVMAAVLSARVARAQLAVIDVAALSRLLQQVQVLSQQLTNARSQLAQAQSLYQSMTGSRDMQRLLSSANPNYLPSDWSQLIAAMQGTGSFTGLSADVNAQIGGNAVLSSTQLASLSGEEQGIITAARQSVALLQALAQQALGNASGRFGDVQQLGAAIGAAADQKSILELQAALGTERGMLQNEQTKLQVLFQAAQAQQWAVSQRQRELVIAGQGSFASRFEPSPSSM